VNKFIFITALLFVMSCKAQNCEVLPDAFTNYDEALVQITKSSFKFSDNANTSNSSWIKDADYYSCDGVKGFFIIKSKSASYIHENVPKTVWTSFKNASSFGTFYNSRIKKEYQLIVK
jgi:hypothetical protein